MMKKILLISGIICVYPILLGNLGPVLGTTTLTFHEPDPLKGPFGAAAWGDHLVISEVFYKTDVGNEDLQFIEIYNPTGGPVALDNYILGEDTGYDDIAVYYNKTSWNPGANEEPFWQFPTGYDIDTGKYLVVAKDGAAFEARFNFFPTFEVTDTSSALDMVRITGANTWNLTDDDECILAFDDSGTIRDVDIIVWGTGSWVNRTEAASPSNKGFYNYNACNGSKPANAPFNWYSLMRTSLSGPENEEIVTSTAYGMSDGSGNYHDETSENCGTSIKVETWYAPTADPIEIPEIGMPVPLAIVIVMGIFLGITFLKKRKKEI
jgi:hypothetical protein